MGRLDRVLESLLTPSAKTGLAVHNFNEQLKHADILSLDTQDSEIWAALEQISPLVTGELLSADGGLMHRLFARCKKYTDSYGRTSDQLLELSCAKLNDSELRDLCELAEMFTSYMANLGAHARLLGLLNNALMPWVKDMLRCCLHSAWLTSKFLDAEGPELLVCKAADGLAGPPTLEEMSALLQCTRVQTEASIRKGHMGSTRAQRNDEADHLAWLTQQGWVWPGSAVMRSALDLLDSLHGRPVVSGRDMKDLVACLDEVAARMGAPLGVIMAGLADPALALVKRSLAHYYFTKGSRTGWTASIVSAADALSTTESWDVVSELGMLGMDAEGQWLEEETDWQYSTQLYPTVDAGMSSSVGSPHSD